MNTLRAVTWNVWWRFGGNWREREHGIIQVLHTVQPDVVGLQECWGDNVSTQARLLGDALGMHAAFIPVGLPPEVAADQVGVVMGLGLLSRWPIATVTAEPLSSGRRDLSALVAVVTHPRGALRVVVGATSWEPERAVETTTQIEQLEHLVLETPHDLPSLLLADLNHDEGFPAVRHLHLVDGWSAAAPDADPRTYSSTNRFASPRAEAQYDRRIDHVRFARGRSGARAIAARIRRDEPDGFPPADHYPVVVDLEF
jgi:endonuclease/exonuclease/phosphatase family metal-dependent hydrolase